jgi:AraC-like DNA-binding protein
MLDSYLPHQIKLPEFSITHLRMSSGWIQQWLNTPASLVGRVLPHDAGWSRALSSFVARLTPEFIVNPPIPEHLVVDHVGVTLALIANEINHAGRKPGAAERSLFERISEILAQRSVESALTVDDVARDAGISTRTLHRCLAAHGHTFGERLIDERIRRAIHMLSFPANDRLPVGEIGLRAQRAAAYGYDPVGHPAVPLATAANYALNARSGRAASRALPYLLHATRHVGVNNLRDQRVRLIELLLVDISAEGRLGRRFLRQHGAAFVVQVDFHIQ